MFFRDATIAVGGELEAVGSSVSVVAVGALPLHGKAGVWCVVNCSEGFLCVAGALRVRAIGLSSVGGSVGSVSNCHVKF